MVVDGNPRNRLRRVLVLFWNCVFSAFFILQLSHASPRWVGVQVLVRDARALSCVGSGVDDLRLVHAAGEGVGRLPIRRLLVLDSPREG